MITHTHTHTPQKAIRWAPYCICSPLHPSCHIQVTWSDVICPCHKHPWKMLSDEPHIEYIAPTTLPLSYPGHMIWCHMPLSQASLKNAVRWPPYCLRWLCLQFCIAEMCDVSHVTRGLFRASIPRSFLIPRSTKKPNVVFVVFFVTHSARIPREFHPIPRGFRAE